MWFSLEHESDWTVIWMFLEQREPSNFSLPQRLNWCMDQVQLSWGFLRHSSYSFFLFWQFYLLYAPRSAALDHFSILPKPEGSTWLTRSLYTSVYGWTVCFGLYLQCTMLLVSLSPRKLMSNKHCTSELTSGFWGEELSYLESVPYLESISISCLVFHTYRISGCLCCLVSISCKPRHIDSEIKPFSSSWWLKTLKFVPWYSFW